MADARTESLHRLLDAHDPAGQDVHWADFLQGYSRLILHVARSVCDDPDRAMDHYAYVVEQLRADDFRRLRTFVADGRSEFSTWLLVVTQRLCRDHQRHIYGRHRNNGNGSQTDDDLAARRRLVDLISATVDLDALVDDRGFDVEQALRTDQMHALLGSALASLDPKDRLLIRLRFEDGCSMPEVARSLEMPSRWHAYRRLDEVLTTLRVLLRRNGVSSGAP